MDPGEYGAKLFNYIGAGCAAISIAMATETGVLDVLLTADKPMTSQDIADKMVMKERYVRELLGALVTAEVIQVDKDSILYHVPEQFRPTLRATSHMCRFVPYYGQRFPAVKECFPRAGPSGVSASTSSQVIELMEGYRAHNKDRHIDDNILAVVPGLQEKLEKGIMVAEFGCGTGVILNNMATRFPASTFAGSDVDEALVKIARKEVADKNLTNITYEVIDVYNIPEDIAERFDWIYVDDVIHDLAYPGKALLGIHRTLKSGGIFSMLGMCVHGSLSAAAGNLNACFLYTTSMLNCLLAETSRHESPAKMGLSWTKMVAQNYLKKTGFKVTAISHNRLENNIVHFVCES